MRTMGEALKLVRLAKGITQTELSQRTSVSKNHISGIESGKTDLSWSMTEKLCDGLGVKLSYIVLIKDAQDPVIAPFIPFIFAEILKDN